MLSRAMSVDRAERIGPTGSDGVEWNTAAKRVKPPSTISSKTTSASLMPSWGRAPLGTSPTLSIFTTSAGWPGWCTAFASGGGGGGGGGRTGRGGGGGSLIRTGGGGGAGAVVVVVAVEVVVVTSSGVLPMVSTHRKSAPQAGRRRARPSRRATTRSRADCAPPNAVTSSHPSGHHDLTVSAGRRGRDPGPRSPDLRAVPWLRMRPVLTPTEMAARDAAAMAGGVDESTLVERAGGAVARGAR